jgi:hypothetical protein
MKRYFAVLTAVAAALLVPIWAHGQPTGLIINGQGTATLTWTLPTTDELGNALPASSIANVGVFYGVSRFSSGTTLRAGCTDRPTSLSSTLCYAGTAPMLPGSATSTPLTLQLDSSQTVYFAAAVLATGGGISRYSNEAAKIFTLQTSAPPATPILVDVQVSIVCTTNLPEVTCSFAIQ